MQAFLKKNLVTGILVLLLAILLFVPNAKAYLLKGLLQTGIFNAGTAREKNSEATQDIANLSFINSQGQALHLADYKGKIIFINFWATWCPPCIAEMGSINALYQKLRQDPRFVFILADADNNIAAAIAFMQKHNYDLPVYGIALPVPGNLFGGSLPTTLVIDTEGKLAQKHEGIAKYDTEKMIAFLKSL